MKVKPISIYLSRLLNLDYCLFVCLSRFELYYNEGSMKAFIVEINFYIVVIYK